MGDCSVKLQREADRSGPSMRKPTARPKAAARQTACDRLSLCVWVRAGAGRLWRKVKNVRKFSGRSRHSARVSLSCWRAAQGRAFDQEW